MDTLTELAKRRESLEKEVREETRVAEEKQKIAELQKMIKQYENTMHPSTFKKLMEASGKLGKVLIKGTEEAGKIAIVLGRESSKAIAELKRREAEKKAKEALEVKQAVSVEKVRTIFGD